MEDNMIVFRKAGNFYSVFDEDAIILHSLFKYKIKDNRVGFPINSIDKITSKLKELHIDYKLDNILTHFDDDNYEKYLIDCRNKTSLDYKINEIMEKINNASYDELSKLIEVIDKFFNEKR